MLGTFDVVPYDGTTPGFLVFHKPLNLYWNAVPCDVKVLVPYSLGPLAAVAPASGFEGTAYTTDGVEQTLYRDLPQWLDYRDQTAMEQLAQETLDTVKNTVCEGSLTYYGKLSGALTKGTALNLAATTHATGCETMNALVRQVALDYVPLQGGGAVWVTRLSFSNRMKPFAGDRLYNHPSYGSQQTLQDARMDLRSAGSAIADQVRASQMRPDEGYQGPLDVDSSHVDPNTGRDVRSARDRTSARDHTSARDLSPSGNTYRGPRKETGLSAADLSAALGNDHQRNNEEARDRRAERRATQEAADRDASRLSRALGNPTGPASKDASPAELAQHQSDRSIDAELRRIAEGGDEQRNRRRGGGPGLGYE